MNYQYGLLVTIIREGISGLRLGSYLENLDKLWRLIFIGGHFRLDGYFYLEIVNWAFENGFYFLAFRIICAMPAEFAMYISNCFYQWLYPRRLNQIRLATSHNYLCLFWVRVPIKIPIANVKHDNAKVSWCRSSTWNQISTIKYWSNRMIKPTIANNNDKPKAIHILFNLSTFLSHIMLSLKRLFET